MQRVALGRAIVRGHKAFLLDEPIGTFDAIFREEMRIELKKITCRHRGNNCFSGVSSEIRNKCWGIYLCYNKDRKISFV